ncbi:MAG: hypothetical protein U0840_25375 [Gemmataceae bacterium]
MNISGLVVTLTDDDRSASIVEAIQNAGPFTLGDRFGPRLTVAMETTTPSACDHWHDWLTQLDGVVKVDVAFVAFDSCEGGDHV